MTGTATLEPGVRAEMQRLDATAAHHKREAARHRRLAREARQQQARIKAECERLGIGVNIIKDLSKPR